MYSILWNKKIIFTLFISTLLSSFTIAQQTTGRWLNRDRDDNLFNFGLIIGTSNAYLATAKTKAFYQVDSILSISPSTQGGIMLGIITSMNINEYLSLSLSPQLVVGGDRSLIFSTQNRRTPYVAKIPSTLLSFPLSVRLSSEKIKDKYRIYVATGARLDFDLSSTEKRKFAEKLVKTKSKSFDIEFALGITFYLPFVKFSPEIKYSYGLTNLHAPNSQSVYSEMIERMNVRMLTISLIFEN